MFCNINRKRLVLESLFTKITGREFNRGVSCEYCKILKNAYFEEHEQMLLKFVNFFFHFAIFKTLCH